MSVSVDFKTQLLEDHKRLTDLAQHFPTSTTPMNDRIMQIMRLHEEMARKVHDTMPKVEIQRLIEYLQMQVIEPRERALLGMRQSKAKKPADPLNPLDYMLLDDAYTLLPIYRRALNLD